MVARYPAMVILKRPGRGDPAMIPTVVNADVPFTGKHPGNHMERTFLMARRQRHAAQHPA